MGIVGSVREQAMVSAGDRHAIGAHENNEPNPGRRVISVPKPYQGTTIAATANVNPNIAVVIQIERNGSDWTGFIDTLLLGRMPCFSSVTTLPVYRSGIYE